MQYFQFSSFHMNPVMSHISPFHFNVITKSKFSKKNAIVLPADKWNYAMT